MSLENPIEIVLIEVKKMKINKIIKEDLKINVHHVGGIGGCGPTDQFKLLGKHTLWTFYDADKTSLLEFDIKGKDYRLIHRAIGNKDGTSEFNLTENASASSLLKPAKSAKEYVIPNTTRTWGEDTQIVQTEKTTINKLDTLKQKGEIEQIDFLSVDAQGSDLDVIKGANNQIKDILGVICEVEFSQLYENQPLFFEVHKHMHDKNFRICRLYNQQHYGSKYYYETFQGHGFLVVGESLFLKNQNICNNLKDLPIDERTKQVIKGLKLAVIAFCFNQPDFAIQLLNKIEEQGISIKEIGEQCKNSYIRPMVRSMEISKTFTEVVNYKNK